MKSDKQIDRYITRHRKIKNRQVSRDLGNLLVARQVKSMERPNRPLPPLRGPALKAWERLNFYCKAAAYRITNGVEQDVRMVENLATDFTKARHIQLTIEGYRP